MHTHQNKTLILSSYDIQSIIRQVGINRIMDELIIRLESTIKNYSDKIIDIPIRSGFNYEVPQVGLVEWMPIYDIGKRVTIKVVGYHPENPNISGLPTILSTVSAYDTSSGHLLGLMDGVLLTALRTGAASAVASKYLAHPESKTLGLIGCGAQAITQLHALSRLFNFEEILIFDTDLKTYFSFEQRVSSLGLNLKITKSTIEDIIQQSDIVCTATSIDVDEGPLFENISTQPHAHFNAVGSDFPGKIELPLDLLKESFICPDFIDQALIEGECEQFTKEEIDADLIEVVQNPLNYQFAQNAKTVFDSTGWALEDRVAFELFMDYAQQFEIGQYIEIEQTSIDAKNPYEFLNVNSLSSVK